MNVLSQHSDHELVRAIAQGDERAFRELFDRYWEPMVHKALLKLGSAADARDVVQEVFFEVWQRRSNHRPADVGRWLAGAVKFKIYAALDRRHRVAAGMTADTSPDNTTQDILTYRDLRAQIEREVQRLPEKCRMVYRLSREEGLKLPEIAAALGISEKTAEAHLTKALKSLRGALKVFSCFVMSF